MEIRDISDQSEDLPVLEAINGEAIPEIQRCALSDMLATGAKVWCVDYHREPAGFMAIRLYRNLVYLAYFAIRKDLRSKGIGGWAVRELIRHYPDKQVVVEYEAPNPPESCNAVKRFYLRNGFFETGWYTSYDDAEFEIACSQQDFNSEEFVAFIREVTPCIACRRRFVRHTDQFRFAGYPRPLSPGLQAKGDREPSPVSCLLRTVPCLLLSGRFVYDNLVAGRLSVWKAFVLYDNIPIRIF